MKYSREAQLAESSINALKVLLEGKWLPRVPVPDIGIDLTINRIENGEVTNKVLWLQVKSTEGDINSLSIKVNHLSYWENSRTPVLLILAKKIKEKFIFYHIFIQKYIKEIINKTKPSWRTQKTIDIKFTNELNLDILDEISTDGFFYLFSHIFQCSNKGSVYWNGEIPQSGENEWKNELIKAFLNIEIEEYGIAIKQLERIIKIYTIPPPHKLSILVNLANSYELMSNYNAAYDNYQAISELSAKMNDREHDLYLAISMGGIALINMHQGNYDDSIKLLDEALQLNQKIGHMQGIFVNLNNIGNIYQLKNEYEQSNEYFQEAFKLLENLDYPTGKAAVYTNIANNYLHQCNVEMAIDYFQKAYALIVGTTDFRGKASVLGGLGNTFKFLLEYEKATNYFMESLEINRKYNFKIGEATCLYNLGNIAMEQSEFDSALEYYTQSLDISEGINNLNGIAENTTCIGLIYLQQLEYQKALDYCTKSLILFREIDGVHGIAEGLFNIGKILFHQDIFSDSQEYFFDSIEISKEYQFPETHGLCLFHLGLIEKYYGNYYIALAYFDHARNYLQSSRNAFLLENLDREKKNTQRIILFNSITPHQTSTASP